MGEVAGRAAGIKARLGWALGVVAMGVGVQVVAAWQEGGCGVGVKGEMGPTKGTGKAQGKAAKAKPAPQAGRWVDRNCNAALNMQRIGESRWRPLELCWWPEQGELPAKGKEYPQLENKRLRDKPPKAEQQLQHQFAAAQ
ncbi:hypothetical protein QJQ45_001267 [Haematococcus lacustris]|nr:hypothetical protein QJQ45_001267 [Haematococcus lacustris]